MIIKLIAHCILNIENKILSLLPKIYSKNIENKILSLLPKIYSKINNFFMNVFKLKIKINYRLRQDVTFVLYLLS